MKIIEVKFTLDNPYTDSEVSGRIFRLEVKTFDGFKCERSVHILKDDFIDTWEQVMGCLKEEVRKFVDKQRSLEGGDKTEVT